MVSHTSWLCAPDRTYGFMLWITLKASPKGVLEGLEDNAYHNVSAWFKACKVDHKNQKKGKLSESNSNKHHGTAYASAQSVF